MRHQQMSSGSSLAITLRDAASSVAAIVTTIAAPCVLASLNVMVVNVMVGGWGCPIAVADSVGGG